MDRGVFHQLLASLFIGTALGCTFYNLSFPTFGVPSLERDREFGITSDQAVLVGSLVPFLGIAGNIVAGLLVDAAGRRKTARLGVTLHLLSCSLAALAPSPAVLLLGRGVGGLASSLIMISCTIYGAETIHPSARHRLNNLVGLMATLGAMAPFVFGPAFEWRGQMWIGVLMILPAALLIAILPQSPVYLVKTGKIEAAHQSLTWFRSSKSQADEELKQVVTAFQKESSSTPDGVSTFKAPYRTPLIVMIVLLVSQQLAGITALMTYTPQIFAHLSVSWTQFHSAIMVTINISMNFLNAVLQEKFNRIPTLVFGTTACVVLHLGVAGFCYVKSLGGFYEEWAVANSFIAVTMIYLFFAVYAVGLGPIPFIYLGEGTPTKIRGPVSAICFTINTLVVGIMMQGFKTFINHVGYHNTFLTLAILPGVAVSLVVPYMLETQGKSVSDIDNYYNKLEKLKKT